MILNAVNSGNVADLVEINGKEYKIDFEQLNKNLEENVPCLPTLYKISNLVKPYDLESLGEFADLIKFGFESDFRDPRVSKVSFATNAFDAIPFYDENPEIDVKISELLKDPKYKKEMFEDFAIGADEVRLKNDPYKIASYFYFVEKVCDELRTCNMSKILKDSLYLEEDLKKNHSQEQSRSQHR